MKCKVQLLEQKVNAAGQVVKINEELDRNFKMITGISFPMSLGTGALLLNSTVNGNELLPKNFGIENMQASSAVAPNERYLGLHDTAEGNKIELEFKDGENAVSYPYILKVQVRLENE